MDKAFKPIFIFNFITIYYISNCLGDQFLLNPDSIIYFLQDKNFSYGISIKNLLIADKINIEYENRNNEKV